MWEKFPIASLTAPALLGITVLLLLLGRLVPRPTLMDKIEECERWRQAYEAEREARATSDAQTIELLELAKTTHKIVEALFGTTERAPRSGGGNELASSQKQIEHGV